MRYEEMSREALLTEYAAQRAAYEAFLAKGLKLDLSRGKPGAEQLDITTEMLDCLNAEDCRTGGGFDCRNYGLLEGTPEAKKLFSDLLKIPEKNLFIGGNSSLKLMTTQWPAVCSTATATVRHGSSREASSSFVLPPAMTAISPSASPWALK